MRQSIRSYSQFRQPLIRFLGKRQQQEHENSHPHPVAPPEFQRAFGLPQSSVQPVQSSAPPTHEKSSTAVYPQFWEAPVRFWKPRVRELEKAEVDAIMSGGASSY